jgi:hypothetical protein
LLVFSGTVKLTKACCTATDRLSGQPFGVISVATLAEVEDRLRVLLEL